MDILDIKEGDERSLYEHLRPAIIEDLVLAGFPSSVAGGIINWYHPKHHEYLDRVDAWQRLLCRAGLDECDIGWFPPCLVDGKLIEVTSYHSIMLRAEPWQVFYIHQVVRLVYKYRGKPRIETDFKAAKHRLNRSGSPSLQPFEKARLSQILYESLIEPDSWDELVGRFGPGSTSESLNEVQKWCWRGDHKIDLPAAALPLVRGDWCAQRRTDPIVFTRYATTKVAEVPKSLKGNRLVSSEPATSMWYQLAVGDALVEQLHEAFPRNVSLRSQERHNELLSDPEACTIDLSDASDYVSRKLVSQILPHWLPYLGAVRSNFALFPDGDLVPLRTFAPMGSGVCFPVLTAVASAVCKYCCGSRPWKVYGDDIIVTLRDYDFVVAVLQRCGLVVNTRKSCCTRVYKESCGTELYGAVDISPVLLRDDPRKLDASTMQSILAKFAGGDYWPKLTEAMMKIADQAFHLRQRWNRHLQRYEVQVLAQRPRKLVALPGDQALSRWFCIRAESSMVVAPRSRGTVGRPVWEDRWYYSLLSHRLITGLYAQVQSQTVRID